MENKQAHWMDTGKLRIRYNLIQKLTRLLELAEADNREFTEEEERLWAQYMDELDRLEDIRRQTE
ncbi:MAG: hypothetical protein PVG14_05525 [Anaerolineales bacterium]|jgi:hypothetical protein